MGIRSGNFVFLRPAQHGGKDRTGRPGSRIRFEREAEREREERERERERERDTASENPFGSFR